jgi:hypothetical protein
MRGRTATFSTEADPKFVGARVADEVYPPRPVSSRETRRLPSARPGVPNQGAARVSAGISCGTQRRHARHRPNAAPGGAPAVESSDEYMIVIRRQAAAWKAAYAIDNGDGPCPQQ